MHSSPFAASISRKSTPTAAGEATGRATLGSSAPGRYLKGASMRLHWMKGRAKRGISSAKWKASKASLGHYPAMKHGPTHHRKVCPIYTHQDGQSPAAMQGCASMLEGLMANRHPVAKPARLVSRQRKLAPTAPKARGTARRKRKALCLRALAGRARPLPRASSPLRFLSSQLTCPRRIRSLVHRLCAKLRRR